MKTKFKFILAIIVLVVVCIVAFISYRNHSAKQKIEQTQLLDKTRVERILAIGQDKSNAIATEVIAKNKSLNSQSKTDKETENKLTAQKMKNSYDALLQMSDMIGKDAAKQKILQELASDPASMAMAQNLLKNLNEAIKYFGDDQAEARVYSIQLLDYVAGQGNIVPLATTITSLGKTLNDEAEWPKNINEDFVDLLISYFKHNDTESFSSSFAQFAKENGYTQKTVKLFEEGLFYSNQKSITPEQYKKISQGLLPNGN